MVQNDVHEILLSEKKELSNLRLTTTDDNS